MKRLIWVTLFSAATLLMAIGGAMLTARPVAAQSTGVCYAVADNGGPFGFEDALVTLDPVTGTVTEIGRTGSFDVEAIAFAPAGGSLYAADGWVLGTLDLATGAFSQIGSGFGEADGVDGPVTIEDIDGLAWDQGSGILYGSQRRDGTPNDVLVQINRTTGTIVQDAFGAGVDYVVIEGAGVLSDIDDIAIDPFTGVLYAASNDGGVGGVLITVDKNTGASTVVGNFDVDDIEGLAFLTDGNLYGSTGKDGLDPDTRNRLYRIDETNAQATFVGEFTNFRDYEALACLSGPTAVSLAGVSVAAGNGLTMWLLAAVLVLGVVTVLMVSKNRLLAAREV